MIAERGLADLVAFAVNRARPENLVLRLFTNDVLPSAADERATFVEVEGGGYRPAVLRGSGWEQEEDAPHAEHAEHVFAFTGPVGAVHGWYMTREKSGRLAWAQRFAGGPYVVAFPGDTIVVTPRFAAAQGVVTP